MTKKQRARPKRKKPESKRRSAEAPREKQQVLTRVAPREDGHHAVRAPLDPLLGDLPGITLKDEREVLFHFGRVDPRLAEAWKRDVVVHEGPITLRRVMYPADCRGATHYAYVDRRLLWYLRHDPSDPIGARWDGYLTERGDPPPGAHVVFVGSDIVIKKCAPQLKDGA